MRKGILNFEGIGPCYFYRLGKRKPRAGEYYLLGDDAFKAQTNMSTTHMVVVPTHRFVRRNSRHVATPL